MECYLCDISNHKSNRLSKTCRYIRRSILNNFEKTCNSCSIDKMTYDDYFKEKDKAIAYMLVKVEKIWK